MHFRLRSSRSVDALAVVVILVAIAIALAAVIASVVVTVAAVPVVAILIAFFQPLPCATFFNFNRKEYTGVH